MRKHEQSLEVLESVHPTRFNKLESLRVSRDPAAFEDDRFDVEIVLFETGRSVETPAPEKLHLRFEKVSGLKIGRLEGLISWLLRIEDVRHQQLEGICFKVVEAEHLALELYCSDWSASVVVEDRRGQ